jgi:hypothetical protein
MRNPSQTLLIGLAALAIARPGFSAEEAYLYHHAFKALSIRFAGPENAGKKVEYLSPGTHHLFVDEIALKPTKGKESSIKEHKFDLCALDPKDPKKAILLTHNHCLVFSFALPTAASITVPVRISGQLPGSGGGSFTFGLVLECTQAMFKSEVILKADPVYKGVPLPFEVVELTPDSPGDRNPVFGFSLLPLVSNGKALHEFGNLRNLSSMESESKVQPAAGCCEGECCESCACSCGDGCLLM